MSAKGPSIAPAPSPGAPISVNVKTEPGVSQIITSKEWVLPPRPKPGRKPSVDTPASKRKAQNRAAQRAFRERRATRVQELEEKLLEVEKEKEVKEMGLVNTINKLKIENQFLLKSLEQLKVEVMSIKSNSSSSSPPSVRPSVVTHHHLMGSNSTVASPMNMYQHQHMDIIKNSPLNHASPGSSSSYSVQQISPAPSADSPPLHHHHHHRHSHSTSTLTPVSNNTSPDKPINANNNNNSVDFDCGICLKDECICASVGLKDVPSKSLEETINSFKPMAAIPLKRKRVNAEQEVDFTKQFAKKPMPDLKRLKKKAPENNNMFSESSSKPEEFNESSPVENCGFCSDDTPCVCREAAKEAARLNESLNQENDAREEEQEPETSLPPIQTSNPNNFSKSALPVMHPGPSVEIRDIQNLTPGAVPTVVQSPAPNNMDSEVKSGCTGNPGACNQCQTDPMSTLFCATVANKVKEDEDAVVDSKSVASPVKANSPPNLSRAGSRTSLPMLTTPSTPIATTPGGSVMSGGMFIPCADAYKTLSRHKKFNSVDFSTLVGKLTTRGMQVEVQSVANVLRELDRRLYN